MDAHRRQALNALFYPRTIAIVGASTDPQKLSAQPLPNLLASRYQGRTYVVNPRVSAIGGVPSYPRLAAIPDQIDVAFIVIPGDAAVQAAREAAELGVRVAVVAVSGFAEEATPDGIARERELMRIAAETGTRIVGPNCNGIYNGTTGLSLGYNSAHADQIPPGTLSVLSHSGALFSVLARRMRQHDLGLSLFVSVGNEADLELLDYVEYCIEDQPSQIVGLLVEALSSGERLRELAQRARERGKHLVALKLGQSETGARATAAHSSRLAGSARAYEALFRDCGIPAVRTVEGLVAAAAFLAAGGSAPRRAGQPGIGAMTFSGAGGSLLADAATRHGLRLTDFTAQTRQELDVFRQFAPVVNPVDLGATGVSATPRVAPLVAADADVDAVVVYYHVLQTLDMRLLSARALVETRRATAKVHAVVAPGTLTPEEEQLLRAGDIQLFHDTEVCLEGLEAYFAALRADAPQAPAGTLLRQADPLAPGLIHLLDGGCPLAEPESMALLRSFGIPCVEGRTVDTVDQALNAARELGWPVVLKAVVPGVMHKSDLHLVALNLATPAEVEGAGTALLARVAGQPSARLLVQPMVAAELEAFVGLATEPPLGTFLLAGLGGLHAEELDDAVLWAVPTTADQVRARLRQTRLGRILAGPRWRYPESLDQLAEILLALQALALACGDRVHTLDLNPLAFTKSGPLALDALVLPGSAARAGQAPAGVLS